MSWQPGDPLYPYDGRGRRLLELIPELPYHLTDSASWPEPCPPWALDEEPPAER